MESLVDFFAQLLGLCITVAAIMFFFCPILLVAIGKYIGSVAIVCIAVLALIFGVIFSIEMLGKAITLLFSMIIPLLLSAATLKIFSLAIKQGDFIRQLFNIFIRIVSFGSCFIIFLGFYEEFKYDDLVLYGKVISGIMVTLVGIRYILTHRK